MKWIEKHRPAHFKDIAGHSEILQQIEGFILSGDIPHFLFWGDPGTGKTTMAEIIAHKLLGDNLNGNFIELNASDNRGIEDMRKIVLGAIKHMPFFSDIKIIFLDEADGLTPDAQDLLRRPMEKAKSALFILCCNDITKISKALCSRCAIYEFKAPPIDDIIIRLKQVCAAEDQDIPEMVLRDISIKSCGDIRRAVNDLQMTAASGIQTTEIDQIMQRYINPSAVMA